LDIYWNILKMHGPINVKSPNNISKWQMGFNSAFKGLMYVLVFDYQLAHGERANSCRAPLSAL
jgi:hypothetical protein